MIIYDVYYDNERKFKDIRGRSLPREKETYEISDGYNPNMFCVSEVRHILREATHTVTYEVRLSRLKQKLILESSETNTLDTKNCEDRVRTL